MTLPRELLGLACLFSMLFVLPLSGEAAQVCGCKRNTSGRVNRITAVPPGAPPTCPASRTLVCWNDQDDAIGVGVANYENPGQSVPGDSSYFSVPFTSEVWDTASMHAAGSTDLVAPVVGRYLVTAAVGFAETATPVDPAYNLRELIIVDCGPSPASCLPPASTSIFGQVIRNATVSTPVQESMMSTSAILDLAAGDVVRIVVTQSSGVSLNLYPRAQAQMQKVN